MPVIAPPAPLLMKDVVLSLGADDYASHASAVTFTPTVAVLTWQGLSPEATITDVSKATWTCGITYAQDWTAADSLARFLYENEGDAVPVTFRPRNGIGPSFTATVTIAPGAIGGVVNAFAEGTVTLGCDRPVLVPAA